MKKSITAMLEIFNANPNSDDTRHAYARKSRNWNPMDVECFWDLALQNYPDDDFKDLAQRAITCLKENELIEYSDILEDYIEWYRDHGAETDVGLTTYTINCIEDDYMECLWEYASEEDEELREQLEAKMEDVDEEEREKALWGIEGPTTRMRNELRHVKHECWYWEWLFRYCLRKSGVVEGVIDCLH